MHSARWSFVFAWLTEHAFRALAALGVLLVRWVFGRVPASVNSHHQDGAPYVARPVTTAVD